MTTKITYLLLADVTQPSCRTSSGQVDVKDGEGGAARWTLQVPPVTVTTDGSGVEDAVMAHAQDDVKSRGLDDVEDEGRHVLVQAQDDEEDEARRRAVDDGRHVLVYGRRALTTVHAAPDGGWGWVIVAVSFLCASIVDGLCSVFGVMLPDLVTHFQHSSSTVAIAGSLLAGGFMLYGR